MVKCSHLTRIATSKESIFQQKVKNATTATQDEIADEYFQMFENGNK